jgi:hypothetical protein
LSEKLECFSISYIFLPQGGSQFLQNDTIYTDTYTLGMQAASSVIKYTEVLQEWLDNITAQRKA